LPSLAIVNKVMNSDFKENEQDEGKIGRESEIEPGFHEKVKNVLRDLKASFQAFPQSDQKKNMLDRLCSIEHMISLVGDHAIPNTSIQLVHFIQETIALQEGLFPGSDAIILWQELMVTVMTMLYDGNINNFQRPEEDIPLLVRVNSPSERTMMGPGMFLVCLHEQSNPVTLASS
jgi:hypothetical protein